MNDFDAPIVSWDEPIYGWDDPRYWMADEDEYAAMHKKKYRRVWADTTAQGEEDMGSLHPDYNTEVGLMQYENRISDAESGADRMQG